MGKITVYGKQNCTNCDNTKKWLREHCIEFEYVDVAVDAAALNMIKEHGYSALPVVSVNNWETSWAGFNVPALVRLLWKEN